MSDINRRTFLAGAAATGAVIGLAGHGASCRLQGAEPCRILVGVMGTGGRGSGLASAFQSQPNVDVTFVCDVDQGRAERAAQGVARVSGRAAPRAVTDFRRILDEKTVDVLVVATCNHWHAPAAILACTAGKHVYVEKPCSYNPREGELLVQAAPQTSAEGMQMGNRAARSYTAVIQAMDELLQRRHRPALPWRRCCIAEQSAASTSAARKPRPWAGSTTNLARPCHVSCSIQLSSLQLALVLEVGQRRAGQQRYSHHRPVPLGSFVDYPVRHWRPLSLGRRSRDARYARRQL